MKRPKQPEVKDFFLADQVERTGVFDKCTPQQQKRIKLVQKWNKWQAIQKRKGEIK